MTVPACLSFLAGKFIVFDGPDGCGKTTQMKMLQEALTDAQVPVLRVREPGGTPIGEQIRELLLSTKTEGMHMTTEMLLYMASRAQLVEQEIKPALAAGKVVLADRFASSTIAYHGGGGGLSVEGILAVADVAVSNVWPDLTIVFDLPIEAAMQRLNPLHGKRTKPSHTLSLFEASLLHDRIEQRDREYFERVRASYLEQAKRWPERYRVVDASRTVPQVYKEVIKTLEGYFVAQDGAEAKGKKAK